LKTLRYVVILFFCSCRGSGSKQVDSVSDNVYHVQEHTPVHQNDSTTTTNTRVRETTRAQQSDPVINPPAPQPVIPNPYATTTHVKEHNPDVLGDLQIYHTQYRAHLFDSGINIIGTILNKSQEITYKDVILKVSYFSEKQTFVDSENFTVNEYITPGSMYKFQLNSKDLPTIGSITVEIIRGSGSDR